MSISIEISMSLFYENVDRNMEYFRRFINCILLFILLCLVDFFFVFYL